MKSFFVPSKTPFPFGLDTKGEGPFHLLFKNKEEVILRAVPNIEGAFNRPPNLASNLLLSYCQGIRYSDVFVVKESKTLFKKFFVGKVICSECVYNNIDKRGFKEVLEGVFTTFLLHDL